MSTDHDATKVADLQVEVTDIVAGIAAEALDEWFQMPNRAAYIERVVRSTALDAVREAAPLIVAGAATNLARERDTAIAEMHRARAEAARLRAELETVNEEWARTLDALRDQTLRSRTWTAGERVTATDLDGRPVAGTLFAFFAWSDAEDRCTRATLWIDHVADSPVDRYLGVVSTSSLRPDSPESTEGAGDE
jgi:hypothetical protein